MFIVTCLTVFVFILKRLSFSIKLLCSSFRFLLVLVVRVQRRKQLLSAIFWPITCQEILCPAHHKPVLPSLHGVEWLYVDLTRQIGLDRLSPLRVARLSQSNIPKLHVLSWAYCILTSETAGHDDFCHDGISALVTETGCSCSCLSRHRCMPAWSVVLQKEIIFVLRDLSVP